MNELLYNLECELVWETNRTQISRLRSKNACVRADVYIGNKILGYKVLNFSVSLLIVQINARAKNN